MVIKTRADLEVDTKAKTILITIPEGLVPLLGQHRDKILADILSDMPMFDRMLVSSKIGEAFDDMNTTGVAKLPGKWKTTIRKGAPNVAVQNPQPGVGS